MLEVDFYNLLFLIEIIIIFGLVYQELLLSPLLETSNKILKDILSEKNITTIENQSLSDNLQDNFDALEKAYEDLELFLNVTTNANCNFKILDKESWKCVISSFFTGHIMSRIKNNVVKIILFLSILIYLILLFAYPYLPIRTSIASIISKEYLYYTVSSLLTIFLTFIIYFIANFKAKENKLSEHNVKFKKLKATYNSKYDNYTKIENLLIEEQTKNAIAKTSQ